MSFKHIPKKQCVEVDWIDTWSNSRWEHLKNVMADDESLCCRSTGYVVRRSRKSIILAASISENGQVGDRVCIPRSCIKVIRKVGVL